MQKLWISWYPHRRTTGLCAAWNIPLQVVGSPCSGLCKWIGQSIETLRLLRRYKSDILFVQNPSLGLAVLVVLVRRLFGYYLVIDAHNEGVRPFIRSSTFVRWLTAYLLKSADMTIVTNSALADDVSRAGGYPMVLPDGLPTPPTLSESHTTREPAPDVMVISTFAPDEPIPAIMQAAALIPETSFAVSGKSEKFAGLGIDLPPNVRLTGFLPDQVYWDYLARAKVVCDLTLMPDCLVCGAYEGLALAKPMVLSDNPATRELFSPAAILTDSDAPSIADAIRRALDEHDLLSNRAAMSRDAFCARWRTQAAEVWHAIDERAAAGRNLRKEKAG